VVGGTLDRGGRRGSITRTPCVVRNGDVAVREEKNLARMLEQGRDVTGNEILSLAEDRLQRAGRGVRPQFFVDPWRRGKPARKSRAIPERAAHGLFERNAALRILFHQVRHDFRVGFRDELVAFLLQFFFSARG